MAVPPAPRDDIIALGYVLCYCVHGGLPWIKEGKLKNDEVIIAKNAYMETLQRSPPLQLFHLLRHGYTMKQGEVPEYAFLKNLLQRMIREKGWSVTDAYDWGPSCGVK